jgi:hypothetical protein
MRHSFLSVLALLLALSVVPAAVSGCRKEDSGLKPEQQQTADRLDEIAKRSGGDWDKLSQSDRDYMVKEIGHGSEQSARMVLSAKGGKLQVHPGGPQGR